MRGDRAEPPGPSGTAEQAQSREVSGSGTRKAVGTNQRRARARDPAAARESNRVVPSLRIRARRSVPPDRSPSLPLQRWFRRLHGRSLDTLAFERCSVRMPCLVAVGMMLSAFAQQPVAPPSPQTPPPVFRSGVDVISIDVVVLDKNRRPVTGLKPADFIVQLDGKAASIDVFAAVTLPEPPRLEGAVRRVGEVPSDVATNRYGNEGRLVVIMMDRTIPAGPPTLTARAIARSAVDALGPDDVAAVVRTGGFAKEGVSQGFTTDKARLRAVIDAPFMGQTAPPDMGPTGLVYGTPEQQQIGNCPDGICVFEAFQRIADAMSGFTGRQKTILFIGADINMPGVNTYALKEAYEKALHALDRANVTVHTVDPTGLETLGVGFTPTGKASAPYSRLDNLKRQGNLAVLPEHTGGRSVVNTNAPQEAVPQIFEERRAYYLLGVRRSDGKSQRGRSGEIGVRVGRGDVVVLSRRRYDLTAGSSLDRGRGDSLDRAIAPLLPATNFPVEIGLMPIFQPSGQPAVNLLLRIGASPEQVQSTGVPTGAGPFDVLVVVFDMLARKVGSVRQPIDAPAAIGDAGFEWMSYLRLKPGRYEVRVGVQPKASSVASSVYGYIDVPELKSGALAMSGVRFESALGASGPQPTLRRTFVGREAIDAFVQVRRVVGSQAPVSVRVTLTDDRDAVAVQQTSELDERAFAADVAAYRYPLPLSELRPGRYVLRIEASQATAVERRAVPFVVGEP